MLVLFNQKGQFQGEKIVVKNTLADQATTTALEFESN